jgi:hypothetical protein
MPQSFMDLHKTNPDWDADSWPSISGLIGLKLNGASEMAANLDDGLAEPIDHGVYQPSRAATAR